MKTSTLKRTLVLVVSGSLFFACKKEKASDFACPVSAASLSGAYKIKTLQYRTSADAAPSDFMSYMDDCVKDNILHLGVDGAYKEEDAGTVCDESQAVTGIWQLHGNTLTSEGILNGKIASWDCVSLVYYIENALKPGDRLTYTLEKQ